MSNTESIKNKLNLLIDSVLNKITLESENIVESQSFSLHKELSEKINTSEIIWEKAFYDIFLEILDLDTGYVNAKKNYTTALLEAGSHENPQDTLYPFLDMLHTRLEKIHLVKRLCQYLGLHNEMDKIIEHELNLIYNTKMTSSRVIELSGPIAGERKL